MIITTDTFKTKKEREIWNFMQKLNECWTKGHPEELNKFFHKDMIILNSDFKEQGKGREICVNSYIEFVNHATILQFKEFNPLIHIYDSISIVSYSFDISYEMNNQNFNDIGKDMFVLVFKNGKWQAIWRMIFIN